LLLLASLALAAVTTSAQVLTAGDGDERITQPVVHVASFGEGFEQLHQQIGEAMGVPAEEEHPNADAESVQRTSTGPGRLAQGRSAELHRWLAHVQAGSSGHSGAGVGAGYAGQQGSAKRDLGPARGL
jgi:hypothetical protein